MACNCFNETEKLCKEALARHMADIKYGAVGGSGDVSITGAVWNLSGKDESRIAIKVKSEFRANKKDGRPKANKTKLENYLRIKFCPFCGTEHTGGK